MRKLSGMKRVLAVLLSAVLLFSSMTVAGVSAAVTSGTEYHYTFDDTDDAYSYSGYYKKNGGNYTNNTINDSEGVHTALVAGGYNSADYLMKMEYVGNLSTSTRDTQRYSAFSLPNNTGSRKNGRNAGQSIHLEQNVTFEITLTYKVTGYASAGALYVGIGSYALHQAMTFSTLNAAKVADITATTSGWQTATITYTPSANKNLYVLLKVDDNRNRMGTTVQIGAVDIVPVVMSTISFSGDSVNIDPISGKAGASITYPANPTRAGYNFVGWFTEGGASAPTMFPTDNLTLVARWESQTPVPSDVWGFETEAVGTELSINGHTVRKATVTDEEHKSGAHALKLTGNDNAGASRPQVMMKAPDGTQIVVEEGRKYEVSFWIKVPSSAGTTQINWWLAASANDTVYAGSDAVNAERIYQKNQMTVTADTWQEVRATIDDCDYSGKLRLGISGNRFGAHSFYIDDFKFADVTPAPVYSTISFGGEGVNVAPISGKAGDPITYPAEPTRDGYKFIGWFTEGGAAAPTEFPTVDVMLIAKWEVSELVPIDAWSFEAETVGTELSINGHSVRKATVTDAEHKSGAQSLMLTGNDRAGAARPQVMIKDHAGEQIVVTQGKKYEISFWIKMPSSAEITEINWWLTASADDTVYSDSAAVNAAVIYQRNLMSVTPDTWQEVTVTINSCEYSGKLRLGISGNRFGAHSFYIDDFRVKDVTPGAGENIQSTISFGGEGVNIAPISGKAGDPITYPAEPTREGYDFAGWFTEGGAAAPHVFPPIDVTLIAKWEVRTLPPIDAWSFEMESVGDELSVSTRTATVTDEERKSGAHSLKLTGNDRSGYARPQVMIKDHAGEQVVIELGKKYEISFWIKVPTAAGTTEINWWLTASADDAAYTNSDAVNAERIYQQNLMSVTPDTWQEVSITINSSEYGGKLRLGISGNRFGAHSFYIDDFVVTEIVPPAPVPPVEGVWGFETEGLEAELSINGHSVRKATVTDAEKFNGNYSLKLTGNDRAGAARPQVMIKDHAGEQVTVKQGKSYELTYWIKVPSEAGTTEINWWLTASADDTVYATSDEVNAQRIYQHNMMTVVADTWQEVCVTIDNCEYSGMLRLGISGNRFGAHSFYIDDVSLREIVPIEANEGVLTFENYEIDTEVDLNGSTVNRIVVTDAIAAKSGTKVAQVTSNDRTGNTRPQMQVGTDDGEQLRIYKGRNYEFKFHIYIPEGSEKYGINYWIAAADHNNVFGTNHPKSAYVLAEVTNGSQPEQGVWTELTLTVTDAPVGGKLRLGVTGNTSTRHTFYIDDISLRMTEPSDAMSEVQSFEDYAPSDKLSVNTGSASIAVTDEDVHTGFKAAKVETVGNAVDALPQMPLIDYMGEPMTVQKGMKYQLSFYVMIPYGEEYDLQCWLAVSSGDKLFTATNPRLGLVMDTVTVPATDRGGWQFVTLTIDDCAKSGELRLGIGGTTDAPHTFYLDDMAIRERSALPGDPDAMNFEHYEVGETISLNRGSSSIVTITDEYSYTGSQAARVDSHDQSGDYRAQFNITDADGNPATLKKGDDCYVTFMIHLPRVTPGVKSIKYWLAIVPEDQADTAFNNTVFTKNDHNLYEKTIAEEALADLTEWTKITIPVLGCPRDGVLRLGVTHSHLDMSKTNYIYIDDIKVEPPQYITVKFDTNGSDSKIDDIVMLAGSLIPFDDADPYLDGSDFMGWYTSKLFRKEDYFDIYSMPVDGEDGDVLTLYARWRKWDDGAADIVLRDEEENKSEYVVEYYDENVWVDGTQGESPYADSHRPTHNDADPIVTTPQEDVDEAVPVPGDGMPPWLIVMIAACAVVVVGGGAVIAAILLKKNRQA